MLKPVSSLGVVGLVGLLCWVAGGCDRGITATEIAESYGITNRYGLGNKDVVKIIESGQADAMIDSGQTRVRTWEKSYSGLFGTRRVLVSEYIIEGHVYKIEVRRAVDPLMAISADRFRWVEYGPRDRTVALEGMDETNKVVRVLRTCSFEATPEVAYTAWRGEDGKVHGVRVGQGTPPDWPQGYTLDLTVRTKEWPASIVSMTALTSDGRRENPRCWPYACAMDGPILLEAPLDSAARVVPNPRHDSDSIYAADGRWVMLAEGPGSMCKQFVNFELHKTLKGLAAVHGYDVRLLDYRQMQNNLDQR